MIREKTLLLLCQKDGSLSAEHCVVNSEEVQGRLWNVLKFLTDWRCSDGDGVEGLGSRDTTAVI